MMKMVLNDLKDFLKEYSFENGFTFIVDTSYGLNVDIDENISDRGDKNDKNTLFLNVVSDGNFEIGEWFLTMNHNVEIGMFKRSFKETNGEEYFNDLTYLFECISKLVIELNKKFEISNPTYTTGVDSLDNNNSAIKLNFTLNDRKTLC